MQDGLLTSVGIRFINCSSFFTRSVVFEQRFHIFIIIIKLLRKSSVILYKLYFSDKIIRYVAKIVN